jgi:hypothetical protein
MGQWVLINGTWYETLAMGAIFTVVSIARPYCLRRVFEGLRINTKTPRRRRTSMSRRRFDGPVQVIRLEIYIGLAKHARCRFVLRERPIAHFTERFARVGAPFIGVGSGFSFLACVTAASHAHVVLRAKALGDRFCGATVYCAHALKLNMTCAILHQFC